MGLVYGVGVNNYAGHISVNGKHNYDYTCWRGALRRCYSDEYHENHPTYKGCSISDEFLFFDCFRTFIVEQKGFNCVDEQGKRYSLGYYSTEIEAFYAYKEAKENYIKELANKWKDQIDIRVYEALMAWAISIDD